MGIFKGLGRLIGRGIEKFGEITHIGIIEDAGRKLQDVCSETSKRTGSTREYEVDTSSQDQTAQIAEVLSGFSLGLKRQSDTLELWACEQISAYIGKLTDELKEVMGDTAEIRALARHEAIIRESVRGKITNVLGARVSLSDSECKKILSMPAGAKKTAEMQKFGNKVIGEGVESLCKTLNSSLEVFDKSLQEVLIAYCENAKNNIASTVKQMQEMIEAHKNDVSTQEENILKPASIQSASEFVLDLLREAV